MSRLGSRRFPTSSASPVSHSEPAPLFARRIRLRIYFRPASGLLRQLPLSFSELPLSIAEPPLSISELPLRFLWVSSGIHLIIFHRLLCISDCSTGGRLPSGLLPAARSASTVSRMQSSAVSGGCAGCPGLSRRCPHLDLMPIRLFCALSSGLPGEPASAG